MNPKFSVIIPIYGVEKYLHQCLQSVIHQTYPHFEVILVDDGSRDNCPRICDEYAQKDTRITVIHKENAGVGAARKTGVQAARGEYICCVDGDDYIDLNYLEEFSKILNEKDYDLVCCGYHRVLLNKQMDVPINADGGSYDSVRMQKKIFPMLLQNELGIYFTPMVWGKAIKRELFMKNQMMVPDEVKMGEDGAVIVPCIIEAHSMYIMDQCFYYYRANPSSITRRKKPLEWKDQFLLADYYAKRIDLSSFDFRQQYYRRVEKGFFTVARSLFYSGEKYTVVRKIILKKIQEEPFKTAISRARYSPKSLGFFIMDFALKHKLIKLVKLAGKLKK